MCELVRQTCVPLLLRARIPDLLFLLIGLCGWVQVFWGWCIFVRAHMIPLTDLYACTRVATGVNVVVILYRCVHIV